MANNSTISIVTPTLNQGRFIEDTIKSLWNQKGPFFIEHIIVDGGSTDNTISIIKKYEQRLKKKNYPIKCKGIKLSWSSGKDKGQSEALNKGFKKAKGYYLSWLNSDDYYCSNNSLNHIYKTFLYHPKIDIVLGNFNTVDVIGNQVAANNSIFDTVQGKINRNKLVKICQLSIISQPSTFFKKELLSSCRLDNNYHFSMDWDLWIQAYLNKLSFYKINKDIAYERIQPEAKTVINHKLMYQEWVKVYKKHDLWQKEKYVFYKNILKLQLSSLPISKYFINKLNLLGISIKGLRS